ncbi:MAG: aldo/keto reductase, partial [Armatimonadetes bacterium]|nr:aldo/keto reductase [Armatimonadota bacterium]
MADSTEQSGGAAVDRRGFLRAGAGLAAAGLIFGDWRPARAAELPKRKLGRTGLEVTTISLGTVGMRDPAHARVVEHAIDSGVNLIHTCPGYTGGLAMGVVADVMKTRRKDVFLALKIEPGDIDAHLRALHTDYVDILIPYREGENASDERMHEGFERLKQQGKIRWIGFASHKYQAETVRAATAAGWWDCCLLAYNVGNREELNPAVQEAVAKENMGFLVMKGSGGLNRNDQGAWQAGLRDLLTNEHLASLTLGCVSEQHLDTNVAAVTERDAAADRRHARHVAACAGQLCSFCGRCDQACPRGIAVTDYMRARMYRDRGEPGLSRELLRS